MYALSYRSNSVQSLSRVRLFATTRTAAHQASLSITNSRSLLKLISIVSVMPSNHLILCRPVLLPPSIFPSIRVFQMSQFSASGGQSIGLSASTSVLPVNTQDWSPLGLAGLTSLKFKGVSRESSPSPHFKIISSSVFCSLYSPALTSIHNYWKIYSFN